MLGALKMQGKEIARKPELYRDREKHYVANLVRLNLVFKLESKHEEVRCFCKIFKQFMLFQGS